MKTMSPIIIVPCYNHADAFSGVAEKLAKFKKPVVIVDDGSTQAQSKKIKNIAKTHNFFYIKNEKNGGKGAAMITGFNFALENGFSHALQIDADGQHAVSDIELFLSIAQMHPKDLIVGNPVYDESAPRARVIGRKITDFWVMIETLNRHMPDVMCGFRVYPLHRIEPILKTIKFKRMGFDIEILVKAVWAKIHLLPVPTKVKYPENGVSHFRVVKDNLKIAMMHTYLCFLKLTHLIFKRG